MIVNNPTKLPAAPVTARIRAMVAPAMLEPNRDTPGIMVEKLLPSMKAVTQPGGMEAMANRKNMALAMKPPITRDYGVELEALYAVKDPGAGYGHQRQAACDHDRQGNSNQPAPADIASVTVVHCRNPFRRRQRWRRNR